MLRDILTFLFEIKYLMCTEGFTFKIKLNTVA